MHVLGGNIAYIRTLNDCICVSLPLYYLLFCDLGAVSALRWNVCPLSLCSFPRLRGTFYSCWYWLNWKFGRVAFFKIRLLSSCHVRPLHSEILPTYTHTHNFFLSRDSSLICLSAFQCAGFLQPTASSFSCNHGIGFWVQHRLFAFLCFALLLLSMFACCSKGEPFVFSQAPRLPWFVTNFSPLHFLHCSVCWVQGLGSSSTGWLPLITNF
jgi:hypothetical protein